MQDNHLSGKVTSNETVSSKATEILIVIHAGFFTVLTLFYSSESSAIQTKNQLVNHNPSYYIYRELIITIISYLLTILTRK